MAELLTRKSPRFLIRVSPSVGTLLIMNGVMSTSKARRKGTRSDLYRNTPKIGSFVNSYERLSNFYKVTEVKLGNLMIMIIHGYDVNNV